MRTFQNLTLILLETLEGAPLFLNPYSRAYLITILKFLLKTTGLLLLLHLNLEVDPVDPACTAVVRLLEFN